MRTAAITPGRALSAVLAALWLALASPAPAQTSSPTTDTEGLKEVEVDLASGVLKGVLPFDEVFLLTGTAPPDVVQIDGEWCYVGRDAAGRLPELLMRFRTEGSIGSCPVDDSGESEPVPLPPWVAPETGGSAAASADRTFYLPVAEPLEPNRNLLFLFHSERSLSAAELAVFQPEVRQGLDGFFRALERRPSPPASLDRTELTRLRDQVRKILDSQPGAGDAMTPRPGSVFDTSAELAAGSEPPWSEPFVTVYQAQIRRRTIDAARPERVTALFRALVVLAPEPAGVETPAAEASVERTLAALQTAIDGLGTDPRNQLDHLLPAPALGALATLRGAPQSYLANVANGLVALDDAAWSTPGAVVTAEAPPTLWSPDETKPVVAALTATRGALAQLADLTRTAAQVDALAGPLGPATVAELPDLRAAVERARDAAGRLLNDLARLEPVLAEREAALDRLSEFLRRTASSEVPVVATSTGSFTTRAKNHVSADVGVLYAGEIGEVVPYFGANFYTRPVNRDVPLSQYSGLAFRRRFSFMIGATVSSVEEASASGRVLRDNVFASSALVVGAGLRLTDSARLSVGVLVLQENASNPLVDDLELAAEPFLAVSIDWDVRSVLGQVGNAIFPGS